MFDRSKFYVSFFETFGIRVLAQFDEGVVDQLVEEIEIAGRLGRYDISELTGLIAEPHPDLFAFGVLDDHDAHLYAFDAGGEAGTSVALLGLRGLRCLSFQIR